MRTIHIIGAFKVGKFGGMMFELDSRHVINFIQTADLNKNNLKYRLIINSNTEKNLTISFHSNIL